MEDQIQIGSNAIRVRLNQLSGEIGFGVFRLVLSTEWTPIGRESLAPARVILSGHLSIGFEKRGTKLVGSFQSLHPTAFGSSTRSLMDARVELVVDLMPHQVDAIERERDGRAIDFELHVAGLLLRPGDDDRGDLDPMSFWNFLRYNVRAVDWLEVLQQWQYAESFLVQSPAFRAGIDVGPAVNRLNEAGQAVSAGDYRRAVALCRDALEAAYGTDDSDLYPELGYRVGKIKEADKTARFWLARRGLWAITNAASHNDETTSQIDWQRRDAVAAISILSALLQQDSG